MQRTTPVLEGQHVRLTPLAEEYIQPLWQVAQHADIWRYMPFDVSTRERFEAYLTSFIEDAARGRVMPFATQRTGSTLEVVGATSFLEIVPAHRRLEIGATWITPEHQRSPVNTEAKLLQLKHAFEVMACNRVEFKTDSLNERSRNALKRIGAREEGTFRNHMVMPDGRIRHSTWFSITREEWPEVEASLQRRLSTTVSKR